MIRLLALAYSSSEMNPFLWIQPRTASFFANSKSFVIFLHLPFKVSLLSPSFLPTVWFFKWLTVRNRTCLASIRIRCCQRSGWPLAYRRFPCRCLWATPARVPFPPFRKCHSPLFLPSGKPPRRDCWHLIQLMNLLHEGYFSMCKSQKSYRTSVCFVLWLL